jgi:hypothetical protein
VDEIIDETPANMNSQPELLGYSALIGATYSSVKLEEIPIALPADAQWRITFDDGAPIDGHLADVVFNFAAMKKAKKAAKKARQGGYHDIRLDTGITNQQQTAEIKGLEASHICRYTPAQENEAYRKSIRIGNRPLHEDVGSFPDWVQQAILQRQASSEKVESPRDEEFDMTTANMPPVASGSGSELQGYSTLLGARYSNVQIEEIPWWFAGDPRWRITFDDRDPIKGHLVDVVLNDTALKTAKMTTSKRQKRRQRGNIKNMVEGNQEYTEEEKAAKIAEIDQDHHLHSYTPKEEGEAYKESIRIGNRPPHKDLSDLPDWVQQEIVQRQSSSEDDLQDNSDPLPGNENTSEADVEDTSPTTIETAVGQPGPLPGNEIGTKANVYDASPALVEVAVGQPEALPGNELQIEANVDDASPVVIEAAAGESGLLPGDKVETEANVDDTSAMTKVQAAAVRLLLLMGDEIETEWIVNDPTFREVDLDAGQSESLPGKDEIEPEPSVGDTTSRELEPDTDGHSGILSGREIETKLSVDDAGSKELERDADPSELQPSHVMGSMSTMKQPVTAAEPPVTVSDSQLQMPQAFAEQANLTQQHQHQHQRQQQPSSPRPYTQELSSTQPPINQQSSFTQATTANIPATTTGLSYEEIHSLIVYGKEGPTSHQALRSKMAQPNILQVSGIQEMIAEFCTKIIWQRYCRLPPASDATPDFTAITSNSYDNRGIRAPTHPIPASFLQRLMRELNHLFEVCREDKRLLILRTIRWPGHEGQDVHALLAEEVRWVRGPDGKWSKQESLGEIGLLLECVGLQNQGSSWKG